MLKCKPFGNNIVRHQNTIQVLRIEELEKEQLRSVAPFRKDESEKVKEKKVSGQKKGHKGHYRGEPAQIDKRIETLLPELCPRCASPDIAVTVRRRQVIEDILPMRSHVTEVITYKGICRQCGMRLMTQDDLQVSQAVGASGVHIGSNAQQLALMLQHHYGLTKRKVCKLFKEQFGISLTPGGLVAMNHRLSDALDVQDKQLLEAVKNARHINTDETGWYVGEIKWTLWVFAGENFTLYRVVNSRSRAELLKIIGENFKGV